MIGLLIFGFFVGLAARIVMPGRMKMGLFATSFLGILGSVVGAWVGELLGFYTIGQPAGFIMATVGALIILIVFSSISKGRT